jgi:hypothetical protein
MTFSGRTGLFVVAKLIAMLAEETSVSPSEATPTRGNAERDEGAHGDRILSNGIKE